MTQEEKAMELMLKYYNLIPIGNVSFAKQFAIIAVDELMEEAYFTDGYYERHKYWEEVKEEIEKL